MTDAEENEQITVTLRANGAADAGEIRLEQHLLGTRPALLVLPVLGDDDSMKLDVTAYDVSGREDLLDFVEWIAESLKSSVDVNRQVPA